MSQSKSSTKRVRLSTIANRCNATCFGLFPIVVTRSTGYRRLKAQRGNDRHDSSRTP